MKNRRNVIDRPIDHPSPENTFDRKPALAALHRGIENGLLAKQTQSVPVRIDMHVHMVGNGSAGSGGWLRLKGWHSFLAGFMIRQLGMPATALEGDLEKIYSDNLLKFVRESSLGAVVLLAYERVHDPDCTPREDL